MAAGIVLGRFIPETPPGAPALAPAETKALAPAPAARAAPKKMLPPPASPPNKQAVARADPAGQPLWRRNAVKVSADPAAPWIAIVIDDVGLNRANSARAAALPGPLTLAFLPYAEGLAAQTARARAAGHELLVHVPMEPESAAEDPGPNALRAALGSQEISRRLEWALDRFEGYVGVSNHMGSRFTADAEAMAAVLDSLGARGLMFLDSRTTAQTQGRGLAKTRGVPFAERDVFLDNELSAPAIERQLDRAALIARRHGYAVAIGHPHTVTLDVLERRLPELRRRGFALVPIAALVARRLASEQRLEGTLVHLDP